MAATVTSERRFREAAQLHGRVVEAVVATCGGIGAEAWTAPMAAGKWSPATVAEHLVVTYDVYLGELAGGAGMAIKVPAWQRLLLRWTMVPRILAGKGFPEGARAPRETRPPAATRPRDEALAAFRERATRLDAAMERAVHETPRRRITHAYFGGLALVDSYVLCARHVEHHGCQLAASARMAP